MKRVLLSMLFAGMVTIILSAQTNHSGTISSNETWYAAGNPHVITGNITVADAVQLTIEPGCEVYFNSARRMTVNGILSANGTSGSPILFSANQAVPNKGDWQYIYFNGADAGNILNYCQFSYGGAGGGMIRVRNSTDNVIISNCQINNSASYGIQLTNGAANPAISDCSINNCDNYPIYTYADRVKDITGSMTFTGNTPNEIYVASQNVTTGTWLNHSVPYIVGGNITVNDLETLTIDAGITLKFNGNYYFRILGSLMANGTSADHITFTSNQIVPAKGNWNRIFFNVAETSVMNYCDVFYAGSGTSSIDVRSSGNNVTISNSTIQEGGGYGIFNRTGSLSYISNVTVQNCDNYPIYLFPDGVYNLSGSLSLSGNAPQDAIWVQGGTLSTTGVWADYGYPYVLGNADLFIPDGVGLDLNAGVTLKMDGNRQIRVNGDFSTLGTAGNMVTLTSNATSPAPGDWENVYYNEVDWFCSMEHTKVEYAGSNNGAIYTRGGNYQYIVLRYLEITNSVSYGIFNANISTPEIYGCTIQNCGDYAIRTGANSVARIGVIDNLISGNNPDAIRVDAQDISNVFSGGWFTNGGTPFVIMGDITLNDGVSMDFNPGVTLKFMAGARLQVEGKLVANGTSSQHITFTSNQTSPAPGDWERIYLNDADAGTIFNYCDVSYGGSTNGNFDIRGTASPITITNSIITNSANDGVYMTNSASCTFLYNEITTNNGEGIFINGATSSTFGSNDTEWNKIYNNGSYELRNGTLDTDAKYVFWGTADCSDVEDLIYDKVDQASLGLVDYVPWLDGSLILPSFATTWNGSVNTSWNIDGNWDNYSPCGMIDVMIPAAPSNQPIVSSTEKCEDLTMEAGSRLTVTSGNSLAVNGNFRMEADENGTASLLENGGLSVSGNSEIQYYLSADRWHYVSPPMDNQTANVFFDIYLRNHNEATNTFAYIEDETTPLNVGQGYTAWSSSIYPLYGPPGDTSVAFSGGNINSGNYNLPVTFTGTGWNLVGNPYPSAIDWDNLGWTKTNIDGTVYVWDGTQYLTWNGATGDLTDGVIPAMQAFFVLANGSSPALSLNNGVRLHGVDPYKESSVENLLKLNVAGNGFSDNTFIHFDENATDGFDNKYDGYKLMGLDQAPQLYSNIGDKLIRMNVMKDLKNDRIIPIGLNVGAEAEYTITAYDLESFGSSANIYLEDKFEKTIVNLSEQTDYTFTASPSDNSDRFLLHFGPILDIEEPVIAVNNDEFSIYSFDHSVYIRNNSNNLISGNVSIFNISGQEMGRAKLFATNLNKIDLNLNSGYYMVKVITGNNVYTQKVFIK
ncbi:MAG: right-handed parallel beta-helix repeat-containing protein [Bacteroidales bacterium]|nr:right-handed parallel beta-helix repeat-containing protein [Bacteroidales bacterium]